MYLFLISPNNSGKTVISQYIAQRFDFYLPPFGNNEGQFTPGVAPMMRDCPWDESRQFDWRFIKANWDSLLQASGLDVFLEASPPNLLRVHQIHAAFGAAARFIFSISNPYSFCGSCIFRYRTSMDRETIASMASDWLLRACRQKLNIEAFADAPRISYESFCASTETADHAVSRLFPEKKPLDREIRFGGKAGGYEGVVDLNPRNIAFFDYAEIETISACLEKETPLLDFFGYELLTRRRYGEMKEHAPRLWELGRSRRTLWSGSARRHHGFELRF